MVQRLKPFVTILICSHDKDKLANCLRALKKQNYPADRLEFLIMTGFQPEGAGSGKQVGCRIAKGEFIAIVDEDNEVCGPEWLNQMLDPLIKDETVVGTACILDVNPEDPIINKYIAFYGTDPVMSYRSLDGNIRCPHFQKRLKDVDIYWLLDMTKDNMLVTGGNCFIYRKSALKKIGGYVQDTDNIASFVERKMCRIAIPKWARTHHKAASSIIQFLKKKSKWSKSPVSKKWNWIEPRLFWEILCNLTVIRNVYKVWRIDNKDRNKPAWSLHPLLAFLTTIIYITNYVRHKLWIK